MTFHAKWDKILILKLKLRKRTEKQAIAATNLIVLVFRFIDADVEASIELRCGRIDVAVRDYMPK